MDNSPKYKRIMSIRHELYEIWTPTIGDFWYCSCRSCWNSDRLWVLEHADVLSIRPEKEWENYYRDVVQAAHTARDCGFGAFWFDYKETGERGFVWLPRLDQLLTIAGEYHSNSYQETLREFSEWYFSFMNLFFNNNELMPTIEQAVLYWMEIRGIIGEIQNKVKERLSNEK